MTSENTAGSHLPIVGLPTSSDPLSNPSNPVWPSIPSRGRARAIAIGAAATIIALLTIGLAFILVRPWLGWTIVGVIVAGLVGGSILYRRLHRPTPPPLPQPATPQSPMPPTPPPLP